MTPLVVSWVCYNEIFRKLRLAGATGLVVGEPIIGLNGVVIQPMKDDFAYNKPLSLAPVLDDMDRANNAAESVGKRQEKVKKRSIILTEEQRIARGIGKRGPLPGSSYNARFAEDEDFSDKADETHTDDTAWASAMLLGLLQKHYPGGDPHARP